MDEKVETIEAHAVDLVDLTTIIVAAYVSKNSVRPSDLSDLLVSVHIAVTGLCQGASVAAPAPQKLTPAQIRKSITPNALISFIDGKPYKTLKRHLTSNGMTIEQYCERYALPRDYPSVAASYSEQRSALAKSVGLGSNCRKSTLVAAAPANVISGKPKRVGQPRKVASPDKA